MSASEGIAHQEALLAELIKEQDADDAETKTLVEAAMSGTAAIDEEAVYKNFRVSYIDPDGVAQKWFSAGSHTLTEILKHAAAVNQTVATRLQGTAVAALQGRGRLQIIRDFKHRAQHRSTKMFHCQERIASLKVGDVG